jgi:multiple sugar transport system ATP-binding protein
MADVRLTNVRKVYAEGSRAQVAVHDLDLSITDGEFMVLVGPSGSGKSTVLRMIAGLESVSVGKVEIGGREVTDLPPKARDIAMVFQNYALYPHMTAYENMAFALQLRGMARPEIEARVREAATILDIGPLLARKPRQMSGGQRQRVAVGRAIVRKPQVFLFDEPLSNLDAKLRVQTRRELAQLHRRLGATMVYVTHDQVEAMTLGDRIAVLADGRLQQVDTPANLYERPRNVFVAGFIGSPAMNLVAGRLAASSENRRFVSDDGAITIPMSAEWRDVSPERRILLGIRPEDVHVSWDGTEGSDPGTARGQSFRATLTMAELTGSEVFVDARIGAQELVGRASSRMVPPPGSELRVSIDERRLHLFDAENTERI